MKMLHYLYKNFITVVPSPQSEHCVCRLNHSVLLRIRECSAEMITDQFAPPSVQKLSKFLSFTTDELLETKTEKLL